MERDTACPLLTIEEDEQMRIGPLHYPTRSILPFLFLSSMNPIGSLSLQLVYNVSRPRAATFKFSDGTVTLFFPDIYVS